jgi:hypothetical protein
MSDIYKCMNLSSPFLKSLAQDPHPHHQLCYPMAIMTVSGLGVKKDKYINSHVISQTVTPWQGIPL